MIKIKFANKSLFLLSDGSIYWPTKKTLILGDLHLEKSSFFAALGDFFKAVGDKVRKFFGGDSAEFDELVEAGVVDDGYFSDSIDRKKAEKASAAQLQTILDEADQLGEEDQQFLRDLIAAKGGVEPAGQGENVGTANTMDETAAMKSEADANKGGGDTAVIATTNNNQSSQTTNITPGGTDTQPGASYAVTDGMPA